jgi:aldehyde dehydrogenase (NAD+)
VKEGSGTLLTGGVRMGDSLSNGFFVKPTVFGDVHPDSDLARFEIFGPVLSVFRFEDERHVVAQANDSRFGLAAYIQTRDIGRAIKLASELEAGSIHVNGWSGMPPNTPFGGYKQSGFGREGGREGLDEFLEAKNVYINYPDIS